MLKIFIEDFVMLIDATKRMFNYNVSILFSSFENLDYLAFKNFPSDFFPSNPARFGFFCPWL